MLEVKIEQLTAAVNELIKVMQDQSGAPFQAPGNPAPVQQPAPAPNPSPLAQPVAAAPASVTPPSPAPLQPVAPAMPAAPVFEAPPVAAPVAAPAAPVAAPAASAPFSDISGMIQYVMGAYKALGPQKGAEIQGVLTGLGYQNINEVKPEHFGALFAGIEALK